MADKNRFRSYTGTLFQVRQAESFHSGQMGRGWGRVAVRCECVRPGLEKSRLKLNIYQPVAFINLSRFKPADINKSRLKFRINERTIQAKSKPSIVNSKMRMPQYHQFGRISVISANFSQK